MADTNGAGDTFATAYMLAQASRWPSPGTFANWAASRAVMMPQTCKPHCVQHALHANSTLAQISKWLSAQVGGCAPWTLPACRLMKQSVAGRACPPKGRMRACPAWPSNNSSGSVPVQLQVAGEETQELLGVAESGMAQLWDTGPGRTAQKAVQNLLQYFRKTMDSAARTA